MIDLNAIVSAAISAAITEATKPLLERIATLESANDILHRTQHEDMVAMRDRITALEGDVSHRAQVQQANITAALAERIAALEFCNAERHQRLRVLEGALTDRVVALEDQAIVTSNRINDRIAALETKLTEANLFTQMVPTPSVLAAQYAPISNEQIKAALQEWATKDSLLEHLDNQEWFWEKLQNRIDAATESAIDAHCADYDHDSYDEMASKVYEADFDDFVTNDSLEDAVREAVGNLSFDISVS